MRTALSPMHERCLSIPKNAWFISIEKIQPLEEWTIRQSPICLHNLEGSLNEEQDQVKMKSTGGAEVFLKKVVTPSPGGGPHASGVCSLLT